MKTITTHAELERLYAPGPNLASTAKAFDHLIPEYRRLVEQSPFVALATSGPDGLDCSPRGDARGFVRVLDDRTLALPDRRGNHRLDSLRNVIDDPRVALLFLIPGSVTTFRVNGRGAITDDEALCASFAVDGQRPRTVLVVHIDCTFFQCGRAIVRSHLWDPAHHVAAAEVPTAGQVLQRATAGAIDGVQYDDGWAERAAGSLW